MKNISFDKKLSYLKHDSIKNYFPLPNIIFSLGLKSGEILVYAYLMCRENRETFQCYPSYSTIGKAVGMSVNTVRKNVNGLVEKRLISTEHTTIITRNGNRQNGTLLYTILPIDQAIEYRIHQKIIKLHNEQMQKMIDKKMKNIHKNSAI